MERFQRLDAIAVALPGRDVDTDQIIPGRFLHKSRDEGYGRYLFHDRRFDGNGAAKLDFTLNAPAYQGAQVLVAGHNFGCGSSREHAVYALFDYGFRAIVAPSFGDIFFGNCFKNGLLAIALPADRAARLMTTLTQRAGSKVGIDLEAQRLTDPDGAACKFEIDGYRKECLLRGIDEIDYTLRHRQQIAGFEQGYMSETSWL